MLFISFLLLACCASVLIQPEAKKKTPPKHTHTHSLLTLFFFLWTPSTSKKVVACNCRKTGSRSRDWVSQRQAESFHLIKFLSQLRGPRCYFISVFFFFKDILLLVFFSSERSTYMSIRNVFFFVGSDKQYSFIEAVLCLFLFFTNSCIFAEKKLDNKKFLIHSSKMWLVWRF